MSYTDLRDFEAEYSFPGDNGIVVKIEKLGGGTVGKKYVGIWRYIVTCKGQEVARGQDYSTGTAKSHVWVARDIASLYDPYGV